MPRSRQAPKIRNLRWIGGSATFLAFSAGTSALNMITSSNSTDTLMRIRGSLVASLDGTKASSELISVAIGAIVMPEGQSTTVVSSPITDIEAPWLFYERFVLGYEEAVIDVIDMAGLSVFRKTIDVKAMRILRPDREVQLVLEQATINGALNINMSVDIRVLLGQH